MSDIKKVVLAYSGGLDTSVILKWLQDTYGCEVVTFTADIGQGEEVEPARAKALQLGIKQKNIYIEDLREEFVRDFVFPMFRANAVYEGEYLLGTSIARPLIAKRLVEIAHEDRRRRDLARRHRQGQRPGALRARRVRARAEHQDHRAVARMGPAVARKAARVRRQARHPGRLQEAQRPSGGAPYSMDANLLHISYEGGILEDPAFEPEESMWRMDRVAGRRRRTQAAGRRARRIAHGDIVAVERQAADAGRRCSTKLNGSAAGTASAGSTSSRTATSA